MQFLRRVNNLPQKFGGRRAYQCPSGDSSSDLHSPNVHSRGESPRPEIDGHGEPSSGQEQCDVPGRPSDAKEVHTP